MERKFRDEFINRVGRIGKQWGLGEPAGRIWGILLFNARPLTQKEIAKQCDYSLSLVSPSLRILENLGVVIVVGKKDKEKQYEVFASFIGSFERLITNFMEVDVKPIIELLSSEVDKIEDKAVKERIEMLIKDYKKMGLMLAFFSKLLATKKSLSVQNLKKFIEKVSKRGEVL
ncbi:MAG: hypothetical protein Q8O03_04310 [Nanoarchaeota archaeon]|nr:hypothetical protein [Nanoarchaeota archaeon]